MNSIPISLRPCSSHPVPASSVSAVRGVPAGMRYEVLEAYEVLAGDQALGRIERFDPRDIDALSGEMAETHCWTGVAGGMRVYWVSKVGAVSHVVHSQSVVVAQQLVGGSEKES